MDDYMYNYKSEIVLQEYCKLYIKQVKYHNHQVIQIINEAINNKKLYIHNNEYNINTTVNNFLKQVINEIEIKISLIDTILYSGEAPEEYRRKLYNYKAYFIIGKTDNTYYLYNEVNYLFPGLEDKDDILYKRKSTLEKIIARLLPIRGGSGESDINIYNNKPELYKNLPEEYDTYSRYIEKLKEESVSDAVHACIYYNLKELGQTKDIFYDVKQIENYLFMAYTYIGKTITNDIFMKIIIDYYNKNKLYTLNYNQFEQLVKDWYKTVRDPNDDPFEGFVEEEEQTIKNKPKSKTKKRHYKNIRTNNNIINPIINNTPISYSARTRRNRGKIEKRPPVDNSNSHIIEVNI